MSVTFEVDRKLYEFIEVIYGSEAWYTRMPERYRPFDGEMKCPSSKCRDPRALFERSEKLRDE